MSTNDPPLNFMSTNDPPEKFYGNPFYQSKEEKPDNLLRLFFSSFADGGDIINLINDSITVNQVLEYYDRSGEPEYLKASYRRLIKILLQQGTLLGKLNRIRISWNDRALKGGFRELVNTDRISVVHKEFETLVKRDIENELSKEIKGEPTAKIIDTSKRYFDLFTADSSADSFPNGTLQKSGYISYALLQILQEIQHELERRFSMKSPDYSVDPHDLFKEQYARSSLINISDANYPSEEWQNMYTGESKHIPDWGSDSIDELLKKIDWNLKITKKAIVRALGIGLCIAGCAGKVASIILVNPVLNDISIKGAAFGATMAIAPDAIPKLTEKWFPNVST